MWTSLNLSFLLFIYYSFTLIVLYEQLKIGRRQEANIGRVYGSIEGMTDGASKSDWKTCWSHFWVVELGPISSIKPLTQVF